MSEIKYTQGVCQDGAAILANGQMLTIEEILVKLRENAELKQILSFIEDEDRAGLNDDEDFRVEVMRHIKEWKEQGE